MKGGKFKGKKSKGKRWKFVKRSDFLMNILIVEPFCTGSHKAWAEGYAQSSKHKVEIISLPGRFWKWRMHGGTVTLAKRCC